MTNRAKFALAGMISKIVPKEVLVGMSPDRRSRRPLFTSNIVRHANVSVAGGVVKATLDAHDLVFSQGVHGERGDRHGRPGGRHVGCSA